MFTVDQLRFDCTGVTGNPVVRTPNLDRLAASGTTFTSAYTPATICVPARQSIITGQYPTAHGARSVRSAIPEARDTLPKRLRAAGYQTAGVGKMHFWPVYADYGLDHLKLAEQDGPGWQVDDYHSRFLKARGLVDQWDLWDQQSEYRKEAPAEYWQTYGARASELPEELYHTTWIADETIRYLQAAERERPFFLWSSFIKPHHPFDPPEPYDSLYRPEEVVVPPRDDLWREKPLLSALGDPRKGYFDTQEMSEEALRNVIVHYYGLITHLDVHIGRVLEALRASGLEDDTLIIFFSDHGDYLGQYGLFLKHPNLPYDALARVPLIITGPQRLVAAAAEVTTPVSTLDLLPTVLDAANIPLPDYVQGESLLPLLTGAGTFSRDAVFIEAGDYRAVRSSRYKYLYGRSTPLGELYDVLEDPYELKNLAEAHPEVVREHRQRLLDWMINSSWDRYRYESWDL